MKAFRKPHVPENLRELVLDLDARLEGGDALTDIWLPHEEWTRLVEAAQEEREKALDVVADKLVDEHLEAHAGASMQAHSFTPPRPEDLDFEPVPAPLKPPKPKKASKKASKKKPSSPVQTDLAKAVGSDA